MVVSTTPLIDKEEGALILKIDAISPEIEWVSALNLSYSSRSTHRGLFGLGWCSSLEWRFPSFGPLWIDACGEVVALTQVSSHMRNQIKMNQKEGKLASLWSKQGSQINITHDLTGRPFRLSMTVDAINRTPRESNMIEILWDSKSNLIRQIGSLKLKHQGLHLVGIGSDVNLGYDGLSNLILIENKPTTSWSFRYQDDLDLLKTATTKACVIDYSYEYEPASNTKVPTKQTLITSQSSCRKQRKQLTVYKYQETPEYLIPLQNKTFERLSSEIHGTKSSL